MKKFMLALCMLAFPLYAKADDGVWQPEDSFAQLNVACTRVYHCTTGQDILHSADTKIIVLPPKVVLGICSAGGGAADSCNFCLTNPPTAKCEWHTEKK